MGKMFNHQTLKGTARFRKAFAGLPPNLKVAIDPPYLFRNRE
jgi:hypothetical protein